MTTSERSIGPAKVFIDRNVRSRSLLIQETSEPKQIQWGPNTIKAQIAGSRRNPARSGDAKWMGREIECLPTIAYLARERKLKLYESHEVRHESWSASRVGIGSRGDIFAGVQIVSVPDALNRSYFGSRTISQITDRCDVIEFCRLLGAITPETIQRELELWNSLPPQMQTNAKNLSRFRSLLSALRYEGHWPDALHLWSAETHGAKYFLTLDRKFIRALTMSARINLPTKPLLPSELLDDLGVTDRKPMPIAEGKFYSFFEIKR